MIPFLHELMLHELSTEFLTLTLVGELSNSDFESVYNSISESLDCSKSTQTYRHALNMKAIPELVLFTRIVR